MNQNLPLNFRIFSKGEAVGRRLLQYGICLVLFSVLCPVAAFAEIAMRYTPNGYGSFLLVGENVSGVADLDIMIDYDSSVFTNPRVDRVEGGVVTGIQKGAAGKVLISINRQQPGPELYVFLRFDNPGKVRVGGIRSVTVTGRDAEEKTSPDPEKADTPFSSPQSTNAGYKSKNDTTAGSTNDSAAVSIAGGTNGTSSAGQDHQIMSDKAGKIIPGADKWITIAVAYSEKSVLQRFMEFKGEKDPQAFVALFNRGEQVRTKQYPSIALSDGKTPVTIRMEMLQEETGSPDIAVWDAELLSLCREDGKNWVASVVPSEGVWDARLILKVGSDAIEVPLVVAPRIEIDGDVNERNFLTALDKYSSGQAVARQWGNVPHLNDYIFTANFLVQRGNPAAKQALR